MVLYNLSKINSFSNYSTFKKKGTEVPFFKTNNIVNSLIYAEAFIALRRKPKKPNNAGANNHNAAGIGVSTRKS